MPESTFVDWTARHCVPEFYGFQQDAQRPFGVAVEHLQFGSLKEG